MVEFAFKLRRDILLWFPALLLTSLYDADTAAGVTLFRQFGGVFGFEFNLALRAHPNEKCADLHLLVLGQAPAVPHREFFKLCLSGQEFHQEGESDLLPVEPFVVDHLKLTGLVVFLLPATEVDLLKRAEIGVCKSH